MKGYKRCSNGHWFKDKHQSCNHCVTTAKTPTINETMSGEKTLDMTGGISNLDKTMNMSGSGMSSDEDTQHFNPELNEQVDLDQTHIGGVDNIASQNKISPRQRRKLVGWLVSYSVDDMGRDFRLYEGRNRIGTKSSNDITISTDLTISGHHATILFRGNKFYLKDELSSNGTFTDTLEDGLTPEQVLELQDGTSILLGETMFKFRTAF